MSHFKATIIHIPNPDDAAYDFEAPAGAEQAIHSTDAMPSLQESIHNCGSDWIGFARPHTVCSQDSIEDLAKRAEAAGCSIASLTPAQKLGQQEIRSLLFTQRDQVIDLNRGGKGCFHFTLDAYIFRRELLEEIISDGTVWPEAQNVNGPVSSESAVQTAAARAAAAEYLFLIRALERAGTYYLSSQPCEVLRPLPLDTYRYPLSYDVDWYEPCIRDIYLPFLLEREDSLIRQSALLYLLELRFLANTGVNKKDILQGKQIDGFFDAAGELLRHIDDALITHRAQVATRMLPAQMADVFLQLKYGSRTGFAIQRDGTGCGLYGAEGIPVALDSTDQVSFQFDAINYEGRYLTIDGELKNIYWADTSAVRITAITERGRYEAVPTQVYRQRNYFGRALWRGYTVQIRIPISEEILGNLYLLVSIGDKTVLCHSFTFPNVHSRLSGRYRDSYWVFGKYLLQWKEGTPNDVATLRIRRASFLTRLKQERMLQRQIHNRRVRLLRILYFLTAPFMREKNIWITFDQLFKAGDNGEYLFRYVRENHPQDVDIYYILNRSAKEYQPLRRACGKVLAYDMPNGLGWYRLRLPVLHAKVIFSVRADTAKYCGLNTNTLDHGLRGLYNAQIVCLQHGLTVQDIAVYQNRLFDNISHYLCASPFEVENITQPAYGYTPEQTSVTGSPRYDGLTGQPKRQILITPTWRRNTTAGLNRKGSEWDYNAFFRHTEYFRVYNDLINDPKLLQCARETGYRLIYLLHPNVSPQIEDFQKNDQVEILSGTDINYETILKESACMVTDFSGIQFDFAYMRRPLVYYRPESLPAMYGEGVDYEAMKFGPVCTKQEDLVDELCRMMRSGLQLQDAYREKIETFFPYHDQKNSERVYETMQQIQGRRQS